MKNSRIIVLLITSILMISCGTNKKLIKNYEAENGKEIPVNIPLDKNLLLDTDNSLKYYGNGKSLDLNTARKIAMSNCLSGLVIKVEGKIKSAMERYMKQYSVNKGNNLENSLNGSFDDYTLIHAESIVSNIKEIDNYLTLNPKTHEYTYWILMEINKEEVIKGLSRNFDNMPQDIKDEINKDKEQFIEYLKSNGF